MEEILFFGHLSTKLCIYASLLMSKCFFFNWQNKRETFWKNYLTYFLLHYWWNWSIFARVKNMYQILWLKIISIITKWKEQESSSLFISFSNGSHVYSMLVSEHSTPRSFNIILAFCLFRMFDPTFIFRLGRKISWSVTYRISVCRKSFWIYRYRTIRLVI